ncbi:MAG: ABC transporter permease [Anaerolineaceae bacterium]|nr:ABC transporter permease [Anaerolineaceae bacterium]
MRAGINFIFRWKTLPALLLVLTFVFMALAAPLISVPNDVLHPEVKVVGDKWDRIPHSPEAGSPLGTYTRQWDVFHSLVWGTREALVFGLVTTLITAGFGIFVGAVSGFMGGRINSLLMRITDAFITVPVIAGIAILAMFIGMIMAQFNTSPYVFFSGDVVNFDVPEGMEYFIWLYRFVDSLDVVMLGLILFSWMPYARLINSQVMRIKNSEFVEAARMLGAKNGRLIWKHLVPNAISPAIVFAAKDVGAMVVLRATFAYIGMGVPSTWAAMLLEGGRWVIGPGGNIIHYWWMFIPVTMTLILFGLGWNLLGDEFNLWLNPKER